MQITTKTSESENETYFQSILTTKSRKPDSSDIAMAVDAAWDEAMEFGENEYEANVIVTVVVNRSTVVATIANWRNDQ